MTKSMALTKHGMFFYTDDGGIDHPQEVPEVMRGGV